MKALIRRFRPASQRSDAAGVLSAIASRPVGRRVINAAYQRASYPRKADFYLWLAKVFRDTGRRGAPGTWSADFAGKPVRTPLTSERLWLDWDFAVGLLGHDWELKETYDNLIRSRARPDLFVDIGANLGGHSLLFLVHRVETLSVEPNPTCHDYIREICALNGVEPRIEPVALGDSTGWTEICFPETETWLGTTRPDAREAFADRSDTVTVRVKQTTLDDVLDGLDARRVVVKIDTEGSEGRILDGGRVSIERLRPLILFESLGAGDRVDSVSRFEDLGYRIAELPWHPDHPCTYLDRSPFVGSSATNFIAVPADQSAGG